jgi:hypothetical protein
VPVAVTLLLVCIVVLATWLVMHVVLVVACVRAANVAARDRWLSVVPPMTAWVAWRIGRRRTVIAWACLIVLYVALRIALAVR